MPVVGAPFLARSLREKWDITEQASTILRRHEDLQRSSQEPKQKALLSSRAKWLGSNAPSYAVESLP
jgi:hypothetical protein